MDLEKRRRLKADGWQSGTVDEFLGLTPQESAFIEMRLSLSHYLKELRTKKQLTQQALAKKSSLANLELPRWNQAILLLL